MDIFTPLYHEGVLFFLLGEYLSYVADKIRGGEILRYHSDFFPRFRFFFHIYIHSDLSLLESGRSESGGPSLSPGCARSALSSWERLLTCISSPHSCVKRVPNYRQYARVTCHL